MAMLTRRRVYEVLDQVRTGQVVDTQTWAGLLHTLGQSPRLWAAAKDYFVDIDPQEFASKATDNCYVRELRDRFWVPVESPSQPWSNDAVGGRRTQPELWTLKRPGPGSALLVSRPRRCLRGVKSTSEAIREVDDLICELDEAVAVDFGKSMQGTTERFARSGTVLQTEALSSNFKFRAILDAALLIRMGRQLTDFVDRNEPSLSVQAYFSEVEDKFRSAAAMTLAEADAITRPMDGDSPWATPPPFEFTSIEDILSSQPAPSDPSQLSREPRSPTDEGHGISDATNQFANQFADQSPTSEGQCIPDSTRSDPAQPTPADPSQLSQDSRYPTDEGHGTSDAARQVANQFANQLAISEVQDLCNSTWSDPARPVPADPLRLSRDSRVSRDEGYGTSDAASDPAVSEVQSVPNSTSDAPVSDCSQSSEQSDTRGYGPTSPCTDEFPGDSNQQAITQGMQQGSERAAQTQSQLDFLDQGEHTGIGAREDVSAPAVGGEGERLDLPVPLPAATLRDNNSARYEAGDSGKPLRRHESVRRSQSPSGDECDGFEEHKSSRTTPQSTKRKQHPEPPTETNEPMIKRSKSASTPASPRLSRPPESFSRRCLTQSRPLMTVNLSQFDFIEIVNGTLIMGSREVESTLPSDWSRTTCTITNGRPSLLPILQANLGPEARIRLEFPRMDESSRTLDPPP